MTVNDDKLQGFRAFEVHDIANPVETGQATGITVPNP